MDRLGWDEALSKCLQQQYSRLRVQLKELETITLPRKVVSISPASSDIELHVFCDASTTAYAAVVYIRQSFDGTVHTRMLTAKTRVAPIGSLCVPRLELCAALLGANLVEAVSSTFPNTKSVRLDRFNGNTGLAAKLSKKLEEIRCQPSSKTSEPHSIQQLEFRADGGESC